MNSRQWSHREAFILGLTQEGRPRRQRAGAGAWGLAACGNLPGHCGWRGSTIKQGRAGRGRLTSDLYIAKNPQRTALVVNWQVRVTSGEATEHNDHGGESDEPRRPCWFFPRSSVCGDQAVQPLDVGPGLVCRDGTTRTVHLWITNGHGG